MHLQLSAQTRSPSPSLHYCLGNLVYRYIFVIVSQYLLIERIKFYISLVITYFFVTKIKIHNFMSIKCNIFTFYMSPRIRHFGDV